jgi:hypothetical protein
MDEIAMRRRGATLYAVDETNAEALHGISENEVVLVVVKARRNESQHRLAWALATKIVNGTGICQGDKRLFMDWLLMKCRHVKWIHDPITGKTTMVPKSISFGRLSQAEFNRLLKRMLHVICEEILPDMPESKLRADVEKMIEGTPNYRNRP